MNKSIENKESVLLTKTIIESKDNKSLRIPSLLENVRMGKTHINVAVYTHFNPVAFLNEEAQISGFDVDLLEEIFTPLKNSETKDSHEIIRYIPIQSFDNMWKLPSDIHLAAGGIADTTERRKYAHDVSWSQPYFNVTRGLVYRKDNITLKTSLREHRNDVINGLPLNAKIIATFGSTGWIDIENKIAEHNRYDIQLIRGTKDEDDLAQLKDGKVDALMRGSFVCDAIAAEHKELEASFHWFLTETVEVGDDKVDLKINEHFCFPVSDSNLANFIDERIEILKKEGKIAELAKKWKLLSCD